MSIREYRGAYGVDSVAFYVCASTYGNPFVSLGYPTQLGACLRYVCTTAAEAESLRLLLESHIEDHDRLKETHQVELQAFIAGS